ncbi:hypothetical protein HELRODRAFT_167964 [Helobdella robusta]|uniref:Uncharacterized protein n=1 Tax=Helobdella robusta TaxID=6412 RepID=T1F005_HELRO|nr:hypothetical protein HELRODRAFT_167964 [Helobdella robusta]ESO10105.1 hypothetical protein HELRODRAFT_167964 [Helobdella robusta]
MYKDPCQPCNKRPFPCPKHAELALKPSEPRLPPTPVYPPAKRDKPGRERYKPELQQPKAESTEEFIRCKCPATTDKELIVKQIAPYKKLLDELVLNAYIFKMQKITLPPWLTKNSMLLLKKPYKFGRFGQSYMLLCCETEAETQYTFFIEWKLTIDTLMCPVTAAKPIQEQYEDYLTGHGCSSGEETEEKDCDEIVDQMENNQNPQKRNTVGKK